ncbi:2264_t:CDS:2 [Cetraspora pellucida]|uniref:2264_t:CDS:1 n=1 Tax=Cetraspora pellucida TaxID=1433469 RepID=A0A9N9AAQ3_9GLOM|nr:2264_t:CDS:2 [Cetraspora pellucida]
MTLPTLPEELKFINGFLQRAQELRNREPVIAYYCNFYSVKLALEKGTKSKESKAFLARLLDVLEEEKKALHDNEAVTDNVVGEAYVENFGIKVFMNADNEDRAGKATKLVILLDQSYCFGFHEKKLIIILPNRKTAKNFLAAAVFLELLKVFGPLNPEIEEKIRYAKWKATDIVKALKEGQIPVPGPPGGEPALQPPQDYTVNPSDNVPSIDQFPSAPLAVDSPSESHMEENGRQPIPGNPPSLPPSIPGFTNDSLRHQPPSSFPSNPPPLPQNYVQPYSSPIYQPTAPNSLPTNQQHVHPYTQFLHHPADVDPGTVATAQKYCKWAISALNYNDVKTAVENMHKALAMLEPYNHK